MGIESIQKESNTIVHIWSTTDRHILTYRKIKEISSRSLLQRDKKILIIVKLVKSEFSNYIKCDFK